MALARWRHHHQGSVVSEADADHYDWKSQYFWSRNTIFSHGLCCVPNGAENNRRLVPSNNAFSRRLLFFRAKIFFALTFPTFAKFINRRPFCLHSVFFFIKFIFKTKMWAFKFGLADAVYLVLARKKWWTERGVGADIKKGQWQYHRHIKTHGLTSGKRLEGIWFKTKLLRNKIRSLSSRKLAFC